MTDRGSSTAGTAVRRAAIVGLVLAVVGFLADVTGLFGFLTGKDLPDLFDDQDASAAAPPSSTGVPSDLVSRTPNAQPPTTSATIVFPQPQQAGAPSEQPFGQGQAPPNPPGPITTTNAIKNFQLSVNPGEFAAAIPRTIVIETWEGGLGTFVDIEIADPTASGGVCPQLTSGPCNLIYSGGGQADDTGYARVDFEWFGDAPGHDNIHHPGIYTITAQDRGTGAKVSIDFTAR